MRGSIMTRRVSWFRTLETIGRVGRAVDSRAAKAHLRRRSGHYAALGIFDGSTFGYRYRSGGMGRLAQYRIGWWREALDAAQAEGAQHVVMRTDQVRWVVAQLEAVDSASTDSPGS